MILYKYLAPYRIDVLRNQKIRFSQPDSFNDPFECRPFLYDYAEIPAKMKISGERILREEGHSEEEIKFLLDQMYEPESYKEFFPKVRDFMRDLMANTVGILSLSEKPDNILMWAHYTENHEGYVIGFTTESNFFTKEGETPTYTTGMLNKVNYSTYRPKNYLTEVTLDQLFFTKSKDWEYEQEWRFFLNIDQADEIIERDPYPICLYQFPSTAVDSIILGLRINHKRKKEIYSILKEDRYRHVKLFITEIDEQEFKINLKEDCLFRGC